ncbi:helix-turn-helix transcriptional regulator [Bosea sp. F3-2]|uniref:winged helix-turn-helix transcriptional regulator n=1 Tax=Bosea sp. F3-2 TaxID=2599640 RepID=UPI0011EE7F44|nr:helix-turn-helix domain-containing protein [Bosea sp. F3-2]QEL22889.1 helix-turn-helix transcriptional regulator [Bosea sp. F3-2]
MLDRIGIASRVVLTANAEAGQPGPSAETQGSNASRPDKFAPAGRERDSEISDTLQILTDPWRFLILREAFFGAERFNEFAVRLQIPRATLTKSLNSLVEGGLLDTRLLSEGPGSWKRYILTESGRDLFPVLLGLMWYGDKWLWEGVPPLALFHVPTRTWFSPQFVWDHDGSDLNPRAVRFEVDVDYWRPREEIPRSYRTDRDGQSRGKRPCSMERTLALVGDRWTFMIFQEFFHGNKRFDEFQRNLNIATNVLSSRLDNLVVHGFLEKRADENGAYRLTPKGRDIYNPMVLLKTWGDNWLRRDRRPTSRFVGLSNNKVTHARLAVPGTYAWIVQEEVKLVPTYCL